jgi:hypothetical protein
LLDPTEPTFSISKGYLHLNTHPSPEKPRTSALLPPSRHLGKSQTALEALTADENVQISLSVIFSKLFDMCSITIFLLAACLLECAYATPIRSDSALQAPLEDLPAAHHLQASSRSLHGRFLHITGGWFKPYLPVRY